jgi:hypothetical protein
MGFYQGMKTGASAAIDRRRRQRAGAADRRPEEERG